MSRTGHTHPHVATAEQGQRYGSYRNAFRAEFTGGTCGRCLGTITKGEYITYGSESRPEHTDCEIDLANVDAGETVLWETRLREDRMGLEEERIAPLQRPVCPACWMELPKSRVCGTCA